MTDEKTDYAVLKAQLCAIQKFIDERDRRYEERFKAMDEKTGLALTSSKEAVTKAEVATEKRFDAVNEFRGTLSDQAATLLPRAEATARFTSYDEKIEEIKRDIVALRESRSQSQGRSSGFSAAWGIAVSILFLAIAVVGLILKIK
jgi:hypothetical protein